MGKAEVILITQARVGSTRLPGKVLKEVHGQSMLGLHLERIAKASTLDKIIVATTYEDGAEDILRIAREYRAESFQGSTNDVLDRFYQAAKLYKPEYVVRVTSDCPLLDPELIDAVVNMTLEAGVDYGANIIEENFPDGQDIEVVKFSALERAWKEAKLPSEREHVTPFIRNNSNIKGGDLFLAKNFDASGEYAEIRMTVDEPEDFEALEKLVKKLRTSAKWQEYAEFIVSNPKGFSNQKVIRNEGYLKSVKKDTEA